MGKKLGRELYDYCYTDSCLTFLIYKKCDHKLLSQRKDSLFPKFLQNAMMFSNNGIGFRNISVIQFKGLDFTGG